MKNRGTLLIERIKCYIEGENPERDWERAEEDTTKVILARATKPKFARASKEDKVRPGE